MILYHTDLRTPSYNLILFSFYNTARAQALSLSKQYLETTWHVNGISNILSTNASHRTPLKGDTKYHLKKNLY